MSSTPRPASTLGLIISRIGRWTLGAWVALVILGCLSSFLSRRAAQLFTAYQHPDTLEGRLAAAFKDLPLRLFLAAILAVPIGLVGGTAAGLLAGWRRSIDSGEGEAKESGERRWLILTGGLWWAVLVPALAAGACLLAGAALDVDLAARPDAPSPERGGGLFGRLANGVNSTDPQAMIGMSLVGACFGLARGTYLARRRGPGPTSRAWGWFAGSLGWLALIAVAGPGLLMFDQLFTSNRMGPYGADEAGRAREIGTGAQWYPVGMALFGWPVALVLGLVWPAAGPAQAEGKPATEPVQ